MSNIKKSLVPKFRTGAREALAANLIEVRYRRIDLDRADSAWRSLCQWLNERPWFDCIQSSGRIREAMRWNDTERVSRQSAAGYRQMWHYLNLAEDIPGEWNPEEISDRQYMGGWVDMDAFNTPAYYYPQSTDPEAFGQLVGGMDVYILNRRMELPSRVLENNTQEVAYGDSRPAGSYFVQEPPAGGLLTPAMTYYREKRVLVRTDVKKGEEPLTERALLVETESPSPLVLVKKREESAWGYRRRRSPTCCFAGREKPMTVKEIMEATGHDQRKVYRLIEKGKAIKVGQTKGAGRPSGLYWCSCHAMSEFVIEDADEKMRKLVEV